MMDGMVGPQFENGLDNLKEVAEAKAAAMPKLEVKESAMDAISYFAIRQEVPIDKMNMDLFSESYATIEEYLGEDMQYITGAPMGMYYNWDVKNNTTDMAVAMPVNSSKEGNDIVMPGQLPAGRVLMVDYFGEYNGTGAAHDLIEKYAQDKGIEITAPALEMYFVGPATEPDAAKWHTRVVYPIAQ